MCSHESIQDFQYEAAWRTANWTLDTPNRADRITGYHQALYTGLTSIKQRDSPMIESALNAAKTQAIRSLLSGGSECTQSMYPYISQLLCVNQIQDMAQVINLDSMIFVVLFIMAVPFLIVRKGW